MYVRFWVMRHGQKAGDALTVLGREQVEQAARRLLMGVTFRAAFHSGMERARQTVEEALQAIGQADVPVEAEKGFGYAWALDELNFPIEAAKKHLPQTPTVADWLFAWPPAQIIRERFIATLVYRACEIAEGHFGDVGTINVLVGSHSPTGELACDNPSEMEPLREAEVIVYTFDLVRPFTYTAKRA